MRATKSISSRLIAGFAITFVLVICLLAVSWKIAVDYRRSIQSSYEDDLVGAVQLANAREALWRLRYGFPQYIVLGPEERAQIAREEPSLYAVVDTNLNDYAAGPALAGGIETARRRTGKLSALHRGASEGVRAHCRR